MRRYQEGGRAVGQPILMPDGEGGFMMGQPVVGPEGLPMMERITERTDRLRTLLGEMGARMPEGALSDVDIKQLEQMTGMQLNPERVGMLESMRIGAEPERPLNNIELNASVRAGEDVAEIEAQQIELSYNTTGLGGRIEEHANGALEWVPNGPGDVPQPPVGDVFYDPIEELRTEQEAQGFARGGAVKKFQNGGLAEAVVPDPLEEVMETDTLELEPMSIEAGDPPPGGLRELAQMNRQEAIGRLQASRDALAARRAKREREDERAKWLAFAQGMLAPTRTGGFGETLGTTAGMLRDEMSSRREMEEFYINQEAMLLSQEDQIERQYLSDLMKVAQIEKTRLGEYSNRRPIGTAALYTHPENPDWLARGQAYHDPDKQNPDGTRGGPVIEWLETSPDGSVARAMHQLDVERRAQLALVEGIAKGEVDRANDDVVMGREAHDLIGKYERALFLLDRVGEGPGTGGWVNLMQFVSEWLGDTSQTVSDLGELRNLLGRQVLDGLKHFPGQISEGERLFMESLETALSKPEGVNRRLLESGLRRLQLRRERGIRAARSYNLRNDLLAMGIDPDAPPGEDAPAGGQSGGGPGSSPENPLIVGPGVARPPPGTWIQLPDGRITTAK